MNEYLNIATRDLKEMKNHLYKQTIKSQDDLGQRGRSVDVLTSTIDELAKVKKQLEIAVEALKTIEKKSDKFDDSWGVQEQLDYIKAEAQSVLYNIKELEK